MGAPVFNPLTLTIFIVVVATVIILAIVLPIVLDSGSDKKNTGGYVPLVAPGHSRTY